MSYQDDIQQVETLILSKQGTWAGISAESVIRMRVQNRFRSGLDIAR
jgi:isocitrate lyase